MKLTVEVTQADIDNGHLNHCRACPVALAICRAVDAGTHVEVHGHRARIGDKWMVRLHEEVEIWIADFDCNGPSAVKPFTFTLDEQATVSGHPCASCGRTAASAGSPATVSRTAIS